MEKVYVIKQNYLMPHDLQPQIELYHTCYTNIEDARAELNNLYISDMELEIFKCYDDDCVTNERNSDYYELTTDEYWSIAEIEELKLI